MRIVQAALMAPTEILAEQHYHTLAPLLEKLGVRCALLTASTKAKTRRSILEQLAAGEIDLAIGTHALLSPDISYQNLGLVVTDEQHRFGVNQRAALGAKGENPHLLVMSATPIPRTLALMIYGDLDVSVIDELPPGRRSIETYAVPSSYHERIYAFLEKQLAEGRQAYIVCPMVEENGELPDERKAVTAYAEKLQKEVFPNRTVRFLHGKMKPKEKETVMRAFAAGEIDVLVSTTVVEVGVDVPNASVMLIENAECFGLSQLHQLRGRVGRSSRHAYAYLTFRKGKVLSEVAEKRLEAIREYAEFGSGFKIAMRDLEIRGAGDLLGSEQSGHMMSVGYDMYLKLLEEAVLEEQGEGALKEPECTADLNITANIAKTYVTSGEQRMDLYRRMAAIRTQEDADELLDEIVDRFGDPPKGVMNLIAIALLRARAAAAGITEITQKDGAILLSLATMDFAAISGCCAEAQFKGRIFFSAGKVPMLSVKLKKTDDPLKLATQLVGVYAALRAQTAGT